MCTGMYLLVADSNGKGRPGYKRKHRSQYRNGDLGRFYALLSRNVLQGHLEERITYSALDHVFEDIS